MQLWKLKKGEVCNPAKGVDGQALQDFLISYLFSICKQGAESISTLSADLSWPLVASI
jgi:hypothetical protein